MGLNVDEPLHHLPGLELGRVDMLQLSQSCHYHVYDDVFFRVALFLALVHDREDVQIPDDVAREVLLAVVFYGLLRFTMRL